MALFLFGATQYDSFVADPVNMWVYQDVRTHSGDLRGRKGRGAGRVNLTRRADFPPLASPSDEEIQASSTELSGPQLVEKYRDARLVLYNRVPKTGRVRHTWRLDENFPPAAHFNLGWQTLLFNAKNYQYHLLNS